MNINEIIPHEILWQILERAYDPRNPDHVAKVCLLWLDLLLQHSTCLTSRIYSVCVSSLRKDRNLNFLGHLVLKTDRLQKLHIRQRTMREGEKISEIRQLVNSLLVHQHYLKTLSLDSSVAIWPFLDEPIVNSLQNTLEELSIAWNIDSELDSSLVKLECFSKLSVCHIHFGHSKLVLPPTTYNTSYNVSDLVKFPSQLKELRLSASNSVVVLLRLDCVPCLTNVVNLSLANIVVAQKPILCAKSTCELVQFLPKLKHLDLVDVPIPQRNLNALFNRAKLETKEYFFIKMEQLNESIWMNATSMQFLTRVELIVNVPLTFQKMEHFCNVLANHSASTLQSFVWKNALFVGSEENVITFVTSFLKTFPKTTISICSDAKTKQDLRPKMSETFLPRIVKLVIVCLLHRYSMAQEFQ